jgi:uncharacterized protein YdhG (YjbR/CyaY superfamily)
MAGKPTNVDEYLATVPDEARVRFEELRRVVRTLAPGAVEVISYGMPTFKLSGKWLAYFGAWKSHYGLYGMNGYVSSDELARYDTDKGTIRFPLEEPLPEALVKKLVSARLTDISAAAAQRGAQAIGGQQ